MTFSPPPPGDRREQLPDRLLPFLAPLSYTSTACTTADDCTDAIGRCHVPAELDAELAATAERLHARCRLTQKFTGQLCVCACHTQETPDA